jgi:hypothetical protein
MAQIYLYTIVNFCINCHANSRNGTDHNDPAGHWADAGYYFFKTLHSPRPVLESKVANAKPLRGYGIPVGSSQTFTLIRVLMGRVQDV